jgi:hypothetical protein
MAEYQQDFTFNPRHLGTLRFNDAEILTIEEALDQETGEPVHDNFTVYLENSITGEKLTRSLNFSE